MEYMGLSFMICTSMRRIAERMGFYRMLNCHCESLPYKYGRGRENNNLSGS